MSSVPRYVAQWDVVYPQLPQDHEKEAIELGCFWDAQGKYVCYSAKGKTFLKTPDFDQEPKSRANLPLHPVPSHCAKK
jgi:hypothetical protein